MVRAVHEASLHRRSMFATLTYSDEHLPDLHSLSRRDVQLFLKRVRKWCKSQGLPSPRFYGCAEYGPQTLRPHYHIIIFGLWFDDGKPVGRSPAGTVLRASETLSQLWGLGKADFAEFTGKAASYVAQYTMAKFESHYGDLLKPVTDPRSGEFGHRRLPFSITPSRPALGIPWLEMFSDDVFNHDQIVLPDFKESGRVATYDEWLKARKPERYEEIKAARLAAAIAGQSSDEASRLLSKSIILEQRYENRKRGAL
jgi:hypothetical protein